jgi:electron transfer flavoprotein beta subunit
VVWNADQIGADPSKIGLAGSPTLVGPGVDIGKPPSQKFVGKTWVFKRPVPELLVDGTRLGPFQVGDIVPQIPEELRRELHSQGVIGLFTLEDLVRELFKVEMYAAKPRF